MKHGWKVGLLTAALMFTGTGCTVSDYFLFFDNDQGGDSVEVSELLEETSSHTDELMDELMGQTAEAGEEKDKPASLGHAILLLDEPQYALSGREINEDIYFVHTQEPIPDESSMLDRGWLVNLKTGEADNYFTMNSQTPYGFSVTHDPSTIGSKEIIWIAGWEGFSIWRKEYVDRDTGKLLGAVTNDSGLKVTADNGEQEISALLAPIDGCADLEDDAEVALEGLWINENLYEFEEEYVVNCIRNDMWGITHYPAFDNPRWIGDTNELKMGLPGVGEVRIPFDTLDPEQMTQNL